MKKKTYISPLLLPTSAIAFLNGVGVLGAPLVNPRFVLHGVLILPFLSESIGESFNSSFISSSVLI